MNRAPPYFIAIPAAIACLLSWLALNHGHLNPCNYMFYAVRQQYPWAILLSDDTLYHIEERKFGLATPLACVAYNAMDWVDPRSNKNLSQ